MWPFRKKPARGADALATIDEAIVFAAERWNFFSRTVANRPGTDLRERNGLFARFGGAGDW